MDPPSPDPLGFPVAHLLQLIALVERWGVRRDELLSGLDVPEGALRDPGARLSVPTMVTLLERARALTGEPAIGMHIGLDIRPTLYGNLGFALMSASNILEAIDLAVRFGPIITTALRIRLRVEGRVASLILDELADFGSARDIVVIAALVSLRRVGTALAARRLTTSSAELAFAEPSYAGKLGEANLPMRFDCPMHRLVFDAHALQVPYTMADPIALRLASDHCQRELDRSRAPARWADAIRTLLARPEPCPSLEEVALALHQTARTLRRHLAAEGVSFSTLRDRELRERALTLVQSSFLSFTAIAERLGYSHVTSFERAFRRWTATTPAEFRRNASRVIAPAIVASADVVPP